MRPPHSRPASGGSLTDGGAVSGSDSLVCPCQRTVAPSRPDRVGTEQGLAEYLDEMVRFQGVLRGRSWPGGGGVGLVKSYRP